MIKLLLWSKLILWSSFNCQESPTKMDVFHLLPDQWCEKVDTISRLSTMGWIKSNWMRRESSPISDRKCVSYKITAIKVISMNCNWLTRTVAVRFPPVFGSKKRVNGLICVTPVSEQVSPRLVAWSILVWHGHFNNRFGQYQAIAACMVKCQHLCMSVFLSVCVVTSIFV